MADTIMNHSCPTLTNIEKEFKQEDLSVLLEGTDVRTLEQRITILSRLIMEATLWNSVGMSKKERYDAAVNAIRLFEGTKSTLWVHDEGESKMPKTMEVLSKEKKDIESRLRDLLNTNKDVQQRKKELLKEAMSHVEVTNEMKEQQNG